MLHTEYQGSTRPCGFQQEDLFWLEAVFYHFQILHSTNQEWTELWISEHQLKYAKSH